VIEVTDKYVNSVSGGTVINMGSHGTTNLYAFQSDTFNFLTNQWIDKSGNGNNVTLKNASSRKGNAPVSPAPASLLTGLLNYYSFNAFSGNLLDAVSGNDGTLSGPTQGVSGKIASCYFFDGTNDYINLASGHNFTTTTSFSVSVWIKCGSVAAGNEYVIDRTTNTNQLLVISRTDDDINFHIRGSNSVGLTSATKANVLNTTSWFHIVGVRNVTTDSTYIYVNGVLGAQKLDATTAAVNPTLRFGSDQGNNVVYAWNGFIDEIGIWNKALTQAEITSLYNAGIGIEYPFIGIGLYYTITGLLTSDAVTVASESDMPTISENGLLRIASDSTVYGVTIKRGGAIWAVLPFCEPYINENMPTIAYDVSGNGNHATCEALAAGNIVTQDNYFYLAQYGYSSHASDLMGADFSTWTGTFPDERPTGITFTNTSSANNYVSNSGNKLLYRFKAAAGSADMKLTDAGILTIGKRYRTDINITSFDTVGTYLQGLIIAQAGFANLYQVKQSIGLWSNDMVATSANWMLNRHAASENIKCVMTEPKCYLVVIVPGLLSKNGNDALGNTLEYSPTNQRWFRYSGDLSFPSALQTSTFNYGTGGLIKSGSLYIGHTYKITKTEINYFGNGKVVGDTISQNDTICRYNLDEVRRVYSKRLFNSDVKYDSLKTYLRGFYYTTKRNKNLANYIYNMDGAGFGNWNHVDKGYIDTLYVLNKTSTVNHSTLITALNVPETTEGIAPISFVWDASNTLQLDSLNNMIDSVGGKYTYAINYGYRMTKANAIALAAAGHELACHTASEDAEFIPSYIGFEDNLTHYTEAQLQTYYAAIVPFFTSKYGVTVRNKIYPGGAFDTVTIRNVLNYFETGSTIFDHFEYIPFYTNSIFPISLTAVEFAKNFNAKSYLGRGSPMDSTKWQLEAVEAAKGLKVYYCHPDYQFSIAYGTINGWAYYRKMLEKITRMQKAGNEIRIYTLSDAMNLINNEL